MTRIVAGSVGGRTVVVPPTGTRPTSERVREALFSRLEHLGVVAGARVLDGFAGSGALGLEAASRGAAQVVLVESGRAAAEVCRRNITALGMQDRVSVAREKVETYVARPVVERWDLVLLDPPYDVPDEMLEQILAALIPALAPEAVLVVERSARGADLRWPPGLSELGSRRYGETVVHLATREEIDPSHR